MLAAVGQQPTGALAGKIVYTVGGHGITADYPGTGAWATQRGDNNDLVEDFGNQDQMTAYVNYLFNAGATVVPLRPVGYQPETRSFAGFRSHSRMREGRRAGSSSTARRTSTCARRAGTASRTW